MRSFDDIKRQLNIVDVVSKYTELKQSSYGQYTGLCPLHSEKTPSFNVDVNKNLYYCFGCSSGGDVLSFIHRVENLPYSEIPLFVKNQFNVKIDDGEYNVEKAAAKNQQLELLKTFCQYFGDRGKEKASEYLRSRVATFTNNLDYNAFYVSKDDAKKFFDIYLKNNEKFLEAALELGIYYKTKTGSFFSPYEDRVVFPMQRHGIIYALNGRVIGPSSSTKKYLLSRKGSVYTKKNFVYGIDYAKEIAKKKDVSYVYVTEGVIDAIALLEADIPAVCTLGARISIQQFSSLLTNFETLYLTFDKDTAGNSGTEISIFNAFEESVVLSGYIVHLPDNMDVADFVNTYSNNLEELNKLKKVPFEDKIINHYIRLTKKSLADQNDLDFLKRKMLTKICKNLYDYRTNEFSKNLIIRLSDRMGYKPSYVFQIIDNSMEAAHTKAAQIISKAATKTFSNICDIADLRLLRLIHSFPDMYNQVQKKDWFPTLSVHTRDLLEIIVESDADPKVLTVDLINRKVKNNKQLFNNYVQILTTSVYKLHHSFNHSKELATLSKIYTIKASTSDSARILKQVRDMHKKYTQNPYQSVKKKVEEEKKKSLVI